MYLLGQFEKEDYEQFTEGIDFSAWLLDGAVLSSCSISAVDDMGAVKTYDVTGAYEIVDDTTVVFWVLAGTPNTPYIITVRAVDDASDHWEASLRMWIRS